MSDQITYDDKADLQVATNIANINKVTASDMNEIKNVVNSHADDIDVANNNITQLHNNKLDIADVLNQASTDTDKPYSADYLNDKLVSVGATAPTDGRRVWFKKGKNLLDYNSFVKGRINNSTGQIEYANNVSSMIITSTSITYTSTKAWNNGVASAFIPIEQGDYIYKIKSASLKVNVYIDYYDNGYNFISRYGTKGINADKETTWAVNFTNANAKYIRLHYEMGFADTITLTEAQLQQGTTATSYEPYIEKSINVDDESFISMSDLVSVGSNKPSDGKKVWFKKGKNLLKLNLITTATTYSGVTFTPNNDGTITLNGTATGSGWVGLSNMEISSNSFNLGAVTNTTKSLTNNNYTLSAKLTNGQVNVSFNSTNKMTSCYLYENTTYNNAILQIQFEEGSTATTYEPYVKPAIYVDGMKIYEMS